MKYQSLLQAFKDLHGIQYIFDKKLPIWQRMMWATLVIATICGVICVSFILSLRYNSNVLQTVIESSAFSIKNIPFPAVTLCNSDRLNMERMDEATNKFLPNATHQLKSTFKEVLRQLNIIRFGWFHYLKYLRKYELDKLNKLNLTEIFLWTMFECHELFVTCKWNHRSVNCCEIFSIQSSDYGFCYAFNSMLSLDRFDSHRQMKLGKKKPIRNDHFGYNSGLRVIFYPKRKDDILNKRFLTGVSLLIHRNFEWPTTGYFIPKSNSVTITLKPIYYGTSNELRTYSPHERQCLFHSEESHENRIYRFSNRLPYLKANCEVDCRRYLMAKYCNCSVELFYPSSPYDACNVTGLVCMNKFNDVLYTEAMASHKGQICNCMAECKRIEYPATLASNLIWKLENRSLVYLNIFFKAPTIFKYRTEPSLQSLQFIVNIGGILAFFFGASILSIVEMIHRSIALMLTHLFTHSKVHPITVSNSNTKRY